MTHTRFFINYLLPHKQQFTAIFLVMVLESLVSLAIPLFIGQFASAILQEPLSFNLFNSVIHFPSGLHYGYLVGAWAILIVLQTLTRYQSSYWVNMVGARVLNNLSCRLYDHVQMLPVSYFSTRKKGEILSLISNDANVVAYFISGILTGLVPSLLIASGALLLMASLNLTLALLIAFCVPGFFILLKVLGRKIKPLSEQVTQQQAGIVSIAAENFSAIKLVKSFSREQEESHKFKQNANAMLNLRQQQFKIQAIISPLIQMLISIGIMLIVLVSAIHYQNGELSISALITLLMYGLLFAKPMSSLAGLYGQWQQAAGASKRIIDVFAVAPEAENLASKKLVISNGEIECKDLSFSYEGKRTLLSHINAYFAGNSVTMIVGKNGSGKTSLLHLLMRFIEPQSGAIFIDGQDISQCELRSLRQHIGIVSQDVALSHGSIFENIAYGQSKASAEAVEEAAKRAGAHEFILSLPNAYNTQVGDNGVLLSGGQRQRISLARTLLLNCKIIIFDEPTSAADSHGRQEFAELISQQLQNHTVLVVTHDEAIADLGNNCFYLSQHTLTRKAQ